MSSSPTFKPAVSARITPGRAGKTDCPAATPSQTLDLFVQSQMAKLTGGVSPIGMGLAFMDWACHLATSPGKQMDLLTRSYAVPVTADGQLADGRFSGPDWQRWPFQQYAQNFLQCQQFWEQATTGVRGVAPHHSQVVNFTARQLLDMLAPSNFLATNPEVQRAAMESGGRSLADGALNWRKDVCRKLAPPGMAVPEPADASYRPGVEVALTPGEVVFRNELMELIQYRPQTATVYREPVLIIPSWIMKYYILDLSPENSMVRYLVAQGHTVFMVSWHNPGAAERNLGMDDYLERGLYAALDQVTAICQQAPIHTVGYCLGGTLLAIGAAALGASDSAAHGTLASVTLLAAQTDFSEPGELGLFIDDSELAFLDALMWKQGYLDGDQMAASFQLLHARDLVWSRMMREYLLGQRSAPNDLMAWNADATRLPFRMHSEYLHGLFLRNDLAEGRYQVGGKPIALANMAGPLFVVGTERDHVSPWRSVYKLHLLTPASIDFVLASGGHNAGIVSEPGHAHRSYRRMAAAAATGGYRSPDQWLAQSELEQGSWWPCWQQWLAQHSASKQIKPPQLARNASLGAAPGHFVLDA
ncbi:PHA/PHB synthase family protein [Duganella qianjiadongensis]